MYNYQFAATTSTRISKVQLINGSACQFWFWFLLKRASTGSANRVSVGDGEQDTSAGKWQIAARHLLLQISLWQREASKEKSLRMFYSLFDLMRALCWIEGLVCAQSWSSNWYLKIVNFFCKVIPTNRDQRRYTAGRFRLQAECLVSNVCDYHSINSHPCTLEINKKESTRRNQRAYMKLTYSAIKIEFMWSYDCLGIRLLPHIFRLPFAVSHEKQKQNLQYQFISAHRY